MLDTSPDSYKIYPGKGNRPPQPWLNLQFNQKLDYYCSENKPELLLPSKGVENLLLS